MQIVSELTREEKYCYLTKHYCLKDQNSLFKKECVKGGEIENTILVFVDSKQTMACLQNFRVVYVKYVYYLTKIWDQNLEANLLKPGADSGGGPRRLVPHLNLTSKASLKT